MSLNSTGQPLAPPTDLEIGRAADLLPIEQVAAAAGIAPGFLEPYGRYIAKVSLAATVALSDRLPSKYVLITSVSPTPLGEGKTTTAIGLAQRSGTARRR